MKNSRSLITLVFFFFFQAEDGIRDHCVTGSSDVCSSDLDLNYIGLPAVDKKTQKTPTLEATEIETILAAAKKLYRVLYCLLAGSGLRISEALGLEIGKQFSADCSIVYVRRQRSKKGHGIEAYPKTDAGIRDIDLAPALAALVKKFISGRTSGFLFDTFSGLAMKSRNTGDERLYP